MKHPIWTLRKTVKQREKSLSGIAKSTTKEKESK